MQKGQIFKIHSDFYYVDSDGATFECKLREVLKKQKQKVFVGDFVEFENGAIYKILPRENYITRPTVANIDQVIIISAVKEPDLSFTQLNRYIAFAKYHNLKTVLCFNKNDLSNDDKPIEKVFSIYEPLGFDILFTSALEGYGIDDFKKILTIPQNAITTQYAQLLKVDNIDLEFTEEAIDVIAELAESQNETSENIGARRLQTIMELLLEDISFNASNENPMVQVIIDKPFVLNTMKDFIKSHDFKKYVL